MTTASREMLEHANKQLSNALKAAMDNLDNGFASYQKGYERGFSVARDKAVEIARAAPYQDVVGPLASQIASLRDD